MRRPTPLETLLLAAAIAAATTPVAEAGGGAARTRPGASASAAPAPRVASGTATYGYSRTGGYPVGPYYPSYYPYGWDWYYGPWWSAGLYWGWPGWSYPYSPCSPGPCRPVEEVASSAPGLVETAVTPRNAKLFLDGEPIGEARDFDGRLDVLPLDPGSRLLRFELQGFRTLEVRLDVRAGRRYRIQHALSPGEGLDPRSDPPAALAETGAPSISSLDAPPPPSAGGVSRGLLRVRARPDDAVVYLDGEFLGRAGELTRLHGALPVAVGEHRIEVVRPGFENARIRVEVSGDEPEEVDVDLRRTE